MIAVCVLDGIAQCSQPRNIRWCYPQSLYRPNHRWSFFEGCFIGADMRCAAPLVHSLGQKRIEFLAALLSDVILAHLDGLHIIGQFSGVVMRSRGGIIPVNITAAVIPHGGLAFAVIRKIHEPPSTCCQRIGIDVRCNFLVPAFIHGRVLLEHA